MVTVFLCSLAYHVAFIATTVVLALPGALTLLGPQAGSRMLSQAWLRATLFWARWAAGIRYSVIGTLPPGPVIVAAKHQSAFETFLLLSRWPKSVYVLKRELFRIPFVGWFMRHSGQIGIDRSAGASAMRQLLNDARAQVALGRNLIIFPEGTRVAPGASETIKPGVAALYSHLKLPVVPIVLQTGHLWPARGMARRAGLARLRVLPPIEPGLPRRAFEARLAAALAEPVEPDAPDTAVGSPDPARSTMSSPHQEAATPCESP